MASPTAMDSAALMSAQVVRRRVVPGQLHCPLRYPARSTLVTVPQVRVAGGHRPPGGDGGRAADTEVDEGAVGVPLPVAILTGGRCGDLSLHGFHGRLHG